MCAIQYWVLLTVAFGTRSAASITLTCDKAIMLSSTGELAKTTYITPVPGTINTSPCRLALCIGSLCHPTLKMFFMAGVYVCVCACV